MASLVTSDRVDTMGSDDFTRLAARVAAVGAAEEWDDELVARTIDEVVADMVPPARRSEAARSAHDDKPNSNDEEDDGEEEQENVEPGPSVDAAAAAKRLRHRQAMQRCRERKRSRMGALEKEQRQLKTLLKQRLWELRLRDDRVGAPPRNAAAALTVDELRKMFVDAVRVKEELLDERQALQASLLEHQKFEKIVASASKQIVNEPTTPPALGAPGEAAQSDSLEDEASSSSQDSADTATNRPHSRRPVGHWVQYLNHEEPLFYEPEPEESVAEHTLECFLRVRRLQDNFGNRLAGLDIHDTFCLGWHAQHTVVRSPDGRLELRFRFQRRVPLQRMSLTEIQRATWEVMKDPVQNARLYSSLVVCKIVQFIGDNTFIFIRNAPDKDKRLHIRYFSMHSQIHYRTDQDERATVTLMKILDKDPHVVEPPVPPTTPVVWLKQGTLFLGFTEKLRTQEIAIEYGGATQCMSEQHAAYLLTEVGGALMRWEQMVIPQRLIS